jgi:hypothetical protein
MLTDVAPSHAVHQLERSALELETLDHIPQDPLPAVHQLEGSAVEPETTRADQMPLGSLPAAHHLEDSTILETAIANRTLEVQLSTIHHLENSSIAGTERTLENSPLHSIDLNRQRHE